MIAYLKGEVLKKELGSIILSVNSIGYRLHGPSSDFNNLNIGQDAEFWIYENIKEDRHDLFGFVNEEALLVFEKVLSVNGAGPKAAMAVLNIGSLNKLKEALLNSDAKYIQQAAGVGKKLAERLILELSGKLSATALENGSQAAGQMQIDEADEAFQALVSLGYSNKDASKALAKVDPTLSSQDRIKLALKGQ